MGKPSKYLEREYLTSVCQVKEREKIQASREIHVGKEGRGKAERMRSMRMEKSKEKFILKTHFLCRYDSEKANDTSIK